MPTIFSFDIQFQYFLDLVHTKQYLEYIHQMQKLDFKKISIQKKVNITPTPKTIYPIRKILRTDYTNIELNSNQRIFVCIYQINHTAKFPFLEYTLWKYPKSNKSYSDLLVFPFQQYKKNKTVQQISQDILKKQHPTKKWHE